MNINETIDEFWNLTFSENEELVDLGFQKWDEFIKKNPEYRNKTSKKLSRSFRKIYSMVNLHDFLVTDIQLDLKHKRMKLHLFDEYQEYGQNLHLIIIYNEVSEYKLNIDSSCKISWMNDMLEFLQNKRFKHRIALTNRGSIDVIFKKAFVKEIIQGDVTAYELK